MFPQCWDIFYLIALFKFISQEFYKIHYLNRKAIRYHAKEYWTKTYDMNSGTNQQ